MSRDITHLLKANHYKLSEIKNHVEKKKAEETAKKAAEKKGA